MLIAIDHDRTYTADSALWDAFMADAANRGHEVVCVTMRHPHEAIRMPVEVIYTARQAKAKHMNDIGRMPDIWIDDSPLWIYQSSG